MKQCQIVMPQRRKRIVRYFGLNCILSQFFFVPIWSHNLTRVYALSLKRNLISLDMVRSRRNNKTTERVFFLNSFHEKSSFVCSSISPDGRKGIGSLFLFRVVIPTIARTRPGRDDFSRFVQNGSCFLAVCPCSSHHYC